MSWFTDLAGKAESLLNNIDQSAAGAIKKNETFSAISDVGAAKDSLAGIDSALKVEETPKHSASETDFKTYKASSLSVKQKSPKRLSRTRVDSSKSKAGPSKDQDDALFDFLNSGDKPSASTPQRQSLKRNMRKSISSTSISSTSNRGRPKTTTDKSELKNNPKDPSGHIHASFHISRSSSTDSTTSRQTNIKSTNDDASNSSEGNEPSSEADVVSYPLDTASESEFELVSNTAASSTVPSERDSGEENHDAADRSTGLIANLRIENKLLQNEINAVQQEMKSLSERNIRSRKDLEKRMSEIQRASDDLRQEYNVKNSQLQAMMMQVNDLENENKSLKRSADSLKTEKERIIGDQTAGSDMHAQAMDRLRLRLEDAESSLIRERDINRSLKEEALQQREKQEEESRTLVDSLRKGEAEKNAQKKRIDDLTKEMNSFREQLTANQHELSDYKQKASRILQSKERLIASLKGGSEADLTASMTASVEMEELRQERDAAKEDLMVARSQLLQLRHELQEVEGQYQQENSVLQAELDDLQRNLDAESGSRKEAEKDAGKYEKEIRREREEATRARAAANERLRDKEEEVAKLRGQLMMRSRSSPEESELESRLHQLTETLLQKQTIVETISAEKSSLVLQLERAEGQIKRLSQENSTRLEMPPDNGDSGVHSRSNMSSAMLEFSNGSAERGVVGRVKNAASAVDRFSVRLGVFLRRYPIARLFVIVYMGLLHLWVMIVLLTYSPEVHGADFHNNLAHGVEQPEAPQVDHGLPKIDS